MGSMEKTNKILISRNIKYFFRILFDKISISGKKN